MGDQEFEKFENLRWGTAAILKIEQNVKTRFADFEDILRDDLARSSQLPLLDRRHIIFC